MFNDMFLRYIKSNCCVHLEIGTLLSWTHLVSLFSILSTTTKAQKKARGPERSIRPCVYDLFDFAPLPPAPRPPRCRPTPRSQLRLAQSSKYPSSHP